MTERSGPDRGSQANGQWRSAVREDVRIVPRSDGGAGAEHRPGELRKARPVYRASSSIGRHRQARQTGASAWRRSSACGARRTTRAEVGTRVRIEFGIHDSGMVDET